jgi:hypothetical protein
MGKPPAFAWIEATIGEHPHQMEMNPAATTKSGRCTVQTGMRGPVKQGEGYDKT